MEREGDGDLQNELVESPGVFCRGKPILENPTMSQVVRHVFSVPFVSQDEYKEFFDDWRMRGRSPTFNGMYCGKKSMLYLLMRQSNLLERLVSVFSMPVRNDKVLGTYMIEADLVEWLNGHGHAAIPQNECDLELTGKFPEDYFQAPSSWSPSHNCSMVRRSPSVVLPE